MLLAAYPERGSAYRIGALVLFAAAAVILTALAFEHFGGYAPCPLCLQQRYAYYAGVSALFFALVLLSAGHTRMVAAVFLAVALIFLANAVLGAYHTGVEWKFWPGPDTCAGTAALVPNRSSYTKLMAANTTGTARMSPNPQASAPRQMMSRRTIANRNMDHQCLVTTWRLTSMAGQKSSSCRSPHGGMNLPAPAEQPVPVSSRAQQRTTAASARARHSTAV